MNSIFWVTVLFTIVVVIIKVVAFAITGVAVV